MSEEQLRKKSQPEETPTTSGASWGQRARRLGALLLSREAAILVLLATLVIHGGILLFYSRPTSEKTEKPPWEVTLGTFRFAPEKAEAGWLAGAEFTLHVSLLPQQDRPAREMLSQHRHRVRQDIEQLLRQAQGGDFDDPKLRSLKRHLQQQLNETLGFRAVGEVIITDLRLQYRESSPAIPVRATQSGKPASPPEPTEAPAQPPFDVAGQPLP
jgi:flagellar basal body-associated protein FliL